PAGAGALELAGRPDFTYTNTSASVPLAFTTTDSSVGGAAVYFALHFGSSLMSIFRMTGFAPVNFTLPLIVPPPCASGTGSCDHAANASPRTATPAATPSFDIPPPRCKSSTLPSWSAPAASLGPAN